MDDNKIIKLISNLKAENDRFRFYFVKYILGHMQDFVTEFDNGGRPDHEYDVMFRSLAGYIFDVYRKLSNLSIKHTDDRQLIHELDDGRLVFAYDLNTLTDYDGNTISREEILDYFKDGRNHPELVEGIEQFIEMYK